MRYDGELYDYVYPHIKDKLIFDIGANIGEVTKKFINKGARVIAVEPQMDLTKGNNFDGVTAIKNVGVSKVLGKITFYKCKKSNSISTCLPAWRKRHKSRKFEEIKIPVVTLDSLIKEFGTPKYIKVDVEGYESYVLGGLTKKVDLISLEYTQGFEKQFNQCAQHIKRLGFSKIQTFLKIKIKGMVNGKRKTIDFYKEFDEFTKIRDLMKYYKSLKKRLQGDMLIYG